MYYRFYILNSLGYKYKVSSINVDFLYLPKNKLI